MGQGNKEVMGNSASDMSLEDFVVLYLPPISIKDKQGEFQQTWRKPVWLNLWNFRWETVHSIPRGQCSYHVDPASKERYEFDSNYLT